MRKMCKILEKLAFINKQCTRLTDNQKKPDEKSTL